MMKQEAVGEMKGRRLKNPSKTGVACVCLACETALRCAVRAVVRQQGGVAVSCTGWSMLSKALLYMVS